MVRLFKIHTRPTERRKSTQRSSSSTTRTSSNAEHLGPVVVTHYVQPSRNSMDATKIDTDQGTPLRFHEPVRGSLQEQSTDAATSTSASLTASKAKAKAKAL